VSSDLRRAIVAYWWARYYTPEFRLEVERIALRNSGGFCNLGWRAKLYGKPYKGHGLLEPEDTAQNVAMLRAVCEGAEHTLREVVMDQALRAISKVRGVTREQKAATKFMAAAGIRPGLKKARGR
jgi:hypothetical protein